MAEQAKLEFDRLMKIAALDMEGLMESGQFASFLDELVEASDRASEYRRRV